MLPARDRQAEPVDSGLVAVPLDEVDDLDSGGGHAAESTYAPRRDPPRSRPRSAGATVATAGLQACCRDGSPAEA